MLHLGEKRSTDVVVDVVKITPELRLPCKTVGVLGSDVSRQGDEEDHLLHQYNVPSYLYKGIVQSLNNRPPAAALAFTFPSSEFLTRKQLEDGSIFTCDP